MKFSQLGKLTAAATTLVVAVIPSHAQPIGGTFEALYLISSSACSLIAVDPSATACGGLFSGNNVGSGNSSSPGEVLTDAYILSRWGVSADGVTFDSPADTSAGAGWTFSLGAEYSGDFVVAVKQGDAFSLYFYDNVASLSSVTYLGYGGTGILDAGVSHFTVYGNSVPAIPEPETYALMLAGLGAIAFMARRRRQR